MLTTPGLHPVNCPGGSFLNSWRLVVSNATSGSSSTGEQGRTFHLEFACLRVPAAAQCSRGTDRYYKAGPGRTAAQYRTTDFRALLDFNPDVGTVGRGYLQPLTGFRVFLDSSGRISAEWWGCELPDSFTPARVYAYRTSPRRPDATTGGVAELGRQREGGMGVAVDERQGRRRPRSIFILASELGLPTPCLDCLAGVNCVRGNCMREEVHARLAAAAAAAVADRSVC